MESVMCYWTRNVIRRGLNHCSSVTFCHKWRLSILIFTTTLYFCGLVVVKFYCSFWTWAWDWNFSKWELCYLYLFIKQSLSLNTEWLWKLTSPSTHNVPNEVNLKLKYKTMFICKFGYCNKVILMITKFARITNNAKLLITLSMLLKVKMRSEISIPTRIFNGYIFRAQTIVQAVSFEPLCKYKGHFHISKSI